jgi:hypothetical protein
MTATPTQVAAEFTRVLKSWLSPGEWSDMVSKNQNDPAYASGACASHDYCDANEAMTAAFQMLDLPLPGDDGDEDVAPEPFRIWNESWTLARASWATEAEQRA